MNKHEYIGWTDDNPTPRHIVGGPITGWATSDAVRQHKCPKCNSDPGYYCESAKGRKVWPPHSDRIAQLTLKQVKACQIKVVSPC